MRIGAKPKKYEPTNIRYTFSIGEDTFYCVDMNSGQSIAVNKGVTTANTLDATKVTEHLHVIADILADPPIQDRFLPAQRTSANVVITEINDTDFEITSPTGWATYTDGNFRVSRTFDQEKVRQALWPIYDVLRGVDEHGSGTGNIFTINHQTNIIRIKHQDTEVISTITPGAHSGYNTLFGCLVNGVPCPVVGIYPDKTRNVVAIYAGATDLQKIDEIPYTPDVRAAIKKLPDWKDNWRIRKGFDEDE